MASAERDRVELMARIEQLEHDNAELEAKNQSMTDENHVLRGELEGLNDTIKDAETKMEFLEATLRDSQRKVRDLEIAAERAFTLERQVAMLEEEQVVLRTSIVRSEEEARTAMYRWRQAEKGLTDLQEQLERIEKEAREERERHIEVISRMERQRAMEKELNTAAGRLKGAAAAKSMTDSKGSGNVVSHFVRDLLQDNATLQVGIAELREMLLSSNDEIQMLREQLMYHQPASGQEPGPPSTLQAELDKKEPPTPPQPPRGPKEVHIHHHYHVLHKQEMKKPKKKRQSLTAGTFSPPPYLSTPSSPITTPVRLQPGALNRALLSPPADDPSSGPGNRWSITSEGRSDLVPSPVPSSPQSENRNSIFDRISAPSPFSPTTSVDPTSPSWRSGHGKKASEFSLGSISEAGLFPTDATHHRAGPPPGYPQRPNPLTRFMLNGRRPHHDITSPYTTDDAPANTSISLAEYTDLGAGTDGVGVEDISSPTSDRFDPNAEQQHRTLRRVVSHESIMSLSNGLDIHTLKARPSQLTLKPLGLTAAGTNLSAVTAQPTLSSGSLEGKRGSVILRDNFALFGQGLPTPRARDAMRTTSNPVRGRDGERGRNTSRAPSKLGKLVSWRPWGGASAHPSPDGSPVATPVVSAAPLPVSAPASSLAIPALSLTPAAASVSSQSGKSPQGSMSSAATSSTSTAAVTASSYRAPGINQPGVIPGFQEYWAAHQRRGPPSKVSVEDPGQVQQALREVLEEER
jgi:hypothetical protein